MFPSSNHAPLPFSWQKSIFLLIAVLCLSSLISSPVALILGFLFSHFLGHPFPSLKGKAVSNLLKVAIIGLGFGMNVHEAMASSQAGFVLIVCSIFLTLLGGMLIGRLLKLPLVPGYLISVGTAICGGSAIAAVSPVVKATEQDMSVSLGVVFLLNAIALILFPAVGHWFGLTPGQFGLWSAIAIHDTSSVVGAANTFGLEALEVATTIKLTRALWIIPISFLSMWLFKGKGKSVKVPWFILGFVAAMLLNTYVTLPFSDLMVKISRAVMVLTLFFIGLNLSVSTIKSAGLKPLLLGLALWLIVSVSSLFVILFT